MKIIEQKSSEKKINANIIAGEVSIHDKDSELKQN